MQLLNLSQNISLFSYVNKKNQICCKVDKQNIQRFMLFTRKERKPKNEYGLNESDIIGQWVMYYKNPHENVHPEKAVGMVEYDNDWQMMR